MRIWPGWRLTVKFERSRPHRCRFTVGPEPMRCIFNSGHPPHGHTCSSDLTAPAVPSPGMLADRRQ